MRAGAVLRVGEAVVAGAPLKAREAGRLSCLHPAKERVLGLLEPGQDLLHDQRGYLPLVGECRVQLRQLGVLLRAGAGDATAAVGGEARFERGRLARAAAPQRLLKLALLFRRRRELLRIGVC